MIQREQIHELVRKIKLPEFDPIDVGHLYAMARLAYEKGVNDAMDWKHFTSFMSHEELKYSNIFEAITEDKGEAAALKFRADLMLVMSRLIEHKQLSQADILLALGISQEQTADLINRKIDSFSSDQLIGYLAILGVQFTTKFAASCADFYASLTDSPPR